MLRWLLVAAALWAAPANAQIVAKQVVMGGGPCNLRAILGSDLLAYWDAARTDTITGGAAPTAWASIVGGYSATVTGAPVWNGSSFGGKPGITFNGTTDAFTFTLAGQFPAAAVASELWVAADNNGVGSRIFLGYGNGTTSGRSAGHNSGVPRAITGDGTAVNTDATSGNVTAPAIVRATFGTTTTISVNGQFGNSAAVTATTTGTRLRLGAGSAAAAANFAQGVLAVGLVTNALSVAKANATLQCLLKRL